MEPDYDNQHAPVLFTSHSIFTSRLSRPLIGRCTLQIEALCYTINTKYLQCVCADLWASDSAAPLLCDFLCVVLRTVLQLPEPWRKVAEVFVVQRCLGWQAVLWEALEEPGGQLLSMVHIAQPETQTHTHTLSACDHTHVNKTVVDQLRPKKWWNTSVSSS